MMKESGGVHSVCFCPSGPIYPDEGRKSSLILGYAHKGTKIEIADLLINKPLEDLQVCEFSYNPIDAIPKNAVIFLEKDNLDTQGVSLLESIVQVEMWP